MAITFDPINKIIQLDTFIVSNREIYTAAVDWSVLSDNFKYGPPVSQIGGEVPIALYITLQSGWKVRPIEADGVTTITGNLLTSDSSSPVAPTLGSFNVLVNIETPLQAAAIAVPAANSIPELVAGIKPNLEIINNNVQKASLLIPANEELL